MSYQKEGYNRNAIIKSSGKFRALRILSSRPSLKYLLVTEARDLF
jgi:hypothetical protein